MKEFPDAILSVDTYYAEIAKHSIDEGAAIINDISAGNLDPDMFAFIIRSKVPYIMMHMKGTPQNMQVNPSYENVVNELIDFYKVKIDYCKQKGFDKLIVDVGFGFGKTVEHNYQLLKDLSNLLSQDHRTTIIVTHNLKEAAQVGDRVAVIINGELKQVGIPKEIKAKPADKSVKDFLKEL